MNSRFDTFRVFLNKKEIDIVTYTKSQKMTCEDVKKSLVNHDGYNPEIEVKKRVSSKNKSY
jgi:flagellar biosynthesis protein FlhB